MNMTVILDWKSFAVVGLTVLGIIFLEKLDSNEAVTVFTHAVDTAKELAIAVSNR